MPLSDIERNNPELKCDNEFGKLERVIVSPPDYMEIKEVINETQKVYVTQNIDVEQAKKQHQTFVDVLRANGTEVLEVPVKSGLNEQVFTRDIGFTIGETLFLANVANQIREGEIPELMSVLNEIDLPYSLPFDQSIEGGDVVIDNDVIWVGESRRTSKEAIKHLDELLPFHKVESLQLNERILHLDCVFNIIDSDTALVFSPAFSKQNLKKLADHYTLIEVDEDEQFTMGTNVLSLGNKKIISLPENKKVNAEMNKLGYEVILVEFSEIIKSGGSFRCCSLPLKRQ